MDARRDANHSHAGLLADSIAGWQGQEETSRVCCVAMDYAENGRWQRGSSEGVVMTDKHHGVAAIGFPISNTVARNSRACCCYCALRCIDGNGMRNVW